MQGGGEANTHSFVLKGDSGEGGALAIRGGAHGSGP